MCEITCEENISIRNKRGIRKSWKLATIFRFSQIFKYLDFKAKSDSRHFQNNLRYIQNNLGSIALIFNRDIIVYRILFSHVCCFLQFLQFHPSSFDYRQNSKISSTLEGRFHFSLRYIQLVVFSLFVFQYYRPFFLQRCCVYCSNSFLSFLAPFSSSLPKSLPLL